MPSSVIRSFSYDASGRTLAIIFTSGRRYRYYEVPSATFEGLCAAPSKGEFFNRQIRDHFRFSAED